MELTETQIRPAHGLLIPQNPGTWRKFTLYFFLFLGGWTLVNLLQASFTQLNPDEAYYWLYAQQLDWGYFDHPPMIALFIRLGSQMLSGELGVRLLTILAQSISLIFIWLTIHQWTTDVRKLILFFGIAGSIALFDVYGFVSTPDAPLLLFESMFLWAYQRFLHYANWKTALWLCLSMTGMIYSKYHGFLIIALVCLSNLRLLKNGYFWAAGVLTCLLYLPHVYWQIHHGFPSLEYHLIDRAEPFQWQYLLEYWPNQMAALNPFTLGFAIYLIIQYRPRDVFEKSLYFIIGGMLLFFWLMTFRGHVEPQWTIAAAVPMIILIFRQATQKHPFFRYVHRFIFPTLLLILLARIILIVPIPFMDLPFYGHREWATALQRITGNRPVVFMDSYQNPSLYTFYTHQPAFTFNSIDYRKNQFDIWKMETRFHDQPCVLVSTPEDPYAQPYPLPDQQTVYLHFTRQLPTVQHLRIHFKFADTHVHAGEIIRLPVQIYNPYSFAVRLQNQEFPVSLRTVWIQGDNKWSEPLISFQLPPTIDAHDTIHTTIQFAVPDLPATHVHMGISFQAGVIKPAFNSSFVSLYLQ
ncbi:MAG: glycosyltransferase family 39 protein [Thermoflavifilum aggregans]|nr:glycosyltransferase family 39 protein [Thermoflavifilum aggregans]